MFPDWFLTLSYSPQSDTLAYDTRIDRPQGDHGPFYVPTAVLGTPPPDATHLLLHNAFQRHSAPDKPT